ncbi:hypothetical protein [Streptomyces sp. WMMC897]|uniref:hypothetical protein n=1 Tax=Streptomyces sp. WMMC897 TaxID=3014782 RepID=UPI0022B6E0E5|nr:hypothetical protein [Streptomyces sp. WMMC897]MCZ7413068.1 hypothetical protein [Streptomyces sp. WMMC897]MCZ7415460.1 hypothetical protein [Streptomyces sp. WMMC897]
MLQLLRRIARRCETHDRPSYPHIRDLETSLGLEPSPPPASLTDALSNPAIIDCRNTWCTRRR